MHFLNTRLFIYNFVNFESSTQTWIAYFGRMIYINDALKK